MQRAAGDWDRENATVAYAVTIETAPPRILAAVRRRVHAGEVPRAFRPALDQVWAFLRSNPGLRTDGHNVFHYDHTSGDPATGFDVDFGVEVTRIFAPHGQVACVTTPAGRAALTVHRGAYSGLSAAHAALRHWLDQHGEKIGAWSQEIYGDWHEDESKLETTIAYALA
jgi:effector-binding domain-containing protein